MSRWLPVVAALALSCNGSVPEPEPSPLLELENAKTWPTEGLHGRAYVVTTPHGIPHIYATNREDLHRVQGFIVARDRYFMLEMVRRLSTARLSELLGDIALEADMEVAGISQAFITRKLHDSMTPEQAKYADAYAAGINDYIAQVKAGELDVPSELEFAGNLLGAEDPSELLTEWNRLDVAALLGTIIFRLGYETFEPGRTADYARIETLFDGAPFAELRTEGVYEDVWETVHPIYKVTSTPDWDHDNPPPPPEGRRSRSATPKTYLPMLDDLAERMTHVRDRNGRDRFNGWGSNAWAVAGTHSADGRAYFAGDGHLELDIPPLLYQVHLDTEHLGGGDTHIHGNLLVGNPFPAIGTNGDVAWTTTQHMGDITDWYSEELQLDANGKPSATKFQGEWKPMKTLTETIKVAEVPALDSVGRTIEMEIFTTFDDRWLAGVEGEKVSEDHTPASGESVVNIQGTYYVPRDMDGDGVISGVTFDFTGLDGGNLFSVIDGWGHSKDVVEFRKHHRGAVALSQNVSAADSSGNIYFSGFQTVPCRDYLPRNPDGTFADGANPRLLIDGTQHAGFTIELDEDGIYVENADIADKCVIDQDQFPWTINPEQGYFVTANNDPGNMSLNGELFDKPYYIGGPWTEGYRADRIDRRLAEEIEAGTLDKDAMASIQADRESVIGRHLSFALLEAIEKAQGLNETDGLLTEADQRAVDLYNARSERIDEVQTRIQAWADGGWQTPSGIPTFYDPEGGGSTDDAVATMIWNVWVGHYVRNVLDDEGIPGRVYFPGGTTGRMRLLDDMLYSRGADNPRGLKSWHEEHQESIFFDNKNTPDVHERSDEIALFSLHRALDFLEGPTNGKDDGGFNTTDMNEWVWGKRHQVKFESLLASFIDEPALAGLLAQFSITPKRLPIAPDAAPGDYRKDLSWFPRGGDNQGVDAANNGLSGTGFRYGSGPVNRMVWALGDGPPEGQEVIPGGQSGMIDSPYFDDQAELWLANEAVPAYFTLEDVMAHAEKRETFIPKE